MQEKENISRILKETKVAMKKGDTLKIKQLSDQTNNTASHTQDADNIAVAVIVYSIGKIIERGYVKDLAGVVREIDNVIRNVGKEEMLQKSLQKLRAEVGKVAPSLRKYIQDVFRKAQINKASKIYEHGISMETTAKLLGITAFELAGYAGQRQVEHSVGKVVGVKGRIKLAMEMFV